MAIPVADDTGTNVTADASPTSAGGDVAPLEEEPACSQKNFDCVDSTSYCLDGVSSSRGPLVACLLGFVAGQAPGAQVCMCGWLPGQRVREQRMAPVRTAAAA